MKQLLLLSAILLLAAVARAQQPKYDTSVKSSNSSKPAKFDNNANVNFTPPVKLKVALTESRLTIVYENREVPAADIRVLDSLMKTIPDLKNIAIEFKDTNADLEKKKAVNAVLKQCQCPVSRNSIKMNRQ